MDFYITLCSNNFTTYFPQNKPSHFTNLCKLINTCYYEVGLIELHVLSHESSGISQAGTCIITSNVVEDRQFGSSSARILRISQLDTQLVFNPVQYVDAAHKTFNAITLMITQLHQEGLQHFEDITADELLLDSTVIATLHFKKKTFHCQGLIDAK